MADVEFKNTLEREGSIVRIILRCGDEYQAMMVYDTILKRAKEGLVVLPFGEMPEEKESASG